MLFRLTNFHYILLTFYLCLLSAFQLENYNGNKQIIVKVSLHTEDEKPHVLEFKGKKNEGSKPDIKELLQEDGTVVYVF